MPHPSATWPAPVLLGLSALLSALFPAAPAASATWMAESPSTQASLLELYTSQGCSSCPPAEAWLSATREHPRLWQTLVPLAWHVTYWDQLGWPDPFARDEHSARQRRQARAAGSGVYTPGMFLNGREWRRWRGSDATAVPASQQPVGRLRLLRDAAHLPNTRVSFRPADSTLAGPLTAHLVWLRMGERSPVAAGENRGRTLTQDFVAGAVRSVALQPLPDGTWATTLDLPASDGADALVAWLTDAGGAYLQATGAPWPGDG